MSDSTAPPQALDPGVAAAAQCSHMTCSPAHCLRVPLSMAVLTLDSVGHSERSTKECPRLARKNSLGSKL